MQDLIATTANYIILAILAPVVVAVLFDFAFYAYRLSASGLLTKVKNIRYGSRIEYFLSQPQVAPPQSTACSVS
ncbi:hypothetical protein BCR43DRAFT_488459 [Syncephalastrum racemosum]|uniref:Uncharacterized protein n=1 Tax=Syncephalastrum racemosum TaxID=13706 RepID=A0A1X2HIM1_SYNRA|nr:hypothetical protein BCR43DRAFT_488459 [Syncephalastrum racemosum]